MRTNRKTTKSDGFQNIQRRRAVSKCSPATLNAVSAVPGMAQRFGTPQANTAGPFTNAIINLMAIFRLSGKQAIYRQIEYKHINIELGKNLIGLACDDKQEFNAQKLDLILCGLQNGIIPSDIVCLNINDVRLGKYGAENDPENVPCSKMCHTVE